MSTEGFVRKMLRLAKYDLVIRTLNRAIEREGRGRDNAMFDLCVLLHAVGEPVMANEVAEAKTIIGEPLRQEYLIATRDKLIDAKRRARHL